MDVNKEDNDNDNKAGSIMDEDKEAEPSQADEGKPSGNIDGEGALSSKSKKGRCKSKLNMAVLMDKQAALMVLESNQLLHLRLYKRYYSEVLNFIRQVEEAAQLILQLLGSTHKTKVLEAMEFFQVAHEYQLDSAKCYETTRGLLLYGYDSR